MFYTKVNLTNPVLNQTYEMYFDRQLRLNSSLTPVLDWIHFTLNKGLHFGFKPKFNLNSV